MSTRVLRPALAAAVLLALPTVALTRDDRPRQAGPETPEVALKALADGNARFVQGKPAPASAAAPARRHELTKGQHPRAIVLSCSDSRVPPEYVFDQGLGDLFVVRTAGNVPDRVALGSIEYAAEHLGSQLVVVMGHSGCGAVTATVEANGKVPEGNLGAIVEAIQPAVEAARARGEADLVAAAVHENELRGARAILEKSPVLQHLAHEGKLEIVTATYDLASGRVVLDSPQRRAAAH